jgi:hypothetical protein
MPDIGQPAGQSAGQALGDLFGQVNRPALNSFVANSQAHNGLVSAQTQDAMIKATQAQEQMQAWEDLVPALRNAGYKESDAQLARVGMVASTNHDSETALKFMNAARLGSPTSTPQEQTLAQQGYEGKVAPLQSVPNNFAVPAGQAPPNIQQSPQGVAQTAATNATAGLTNVKADAGGFAPKAPQTKLDPVQAAEAAEFIKQNPNLAGNLRSLLANGGPDVIHAFLHPDPTAAPSTPANGITPAPGVSLAEQAAIRKDFASGTAAKQTTALNTMVQHSQLFDTIADQIGNGNFTPTNYINQLWQRTFGSPVPANLQIAGDFLAREAVKATVNSGSGTGAERELAVGGTSSPDQLHGAAQTLRSLAAGQLHSLDLRAQRGGVDVAQLLGPEARAAFGRQPVSVTAAGPAPGDESPNGAGPQLPAYATEQQALAAGHKIGDKVIIGGVSGTLQ